MRLQIRLCENYLTFFHRFKWFLGFSSEEKLKFLTFVKTFYFSREQELYQNKALLSKESKDKLELNFMYEPPPGTYFVCLIINF